MPDTKRVRRLCFLVPDGQGWLSILDIQPLAAGERSYVALAGDFRRRPGSDRYADLTAPGGPLWHQEKAASGSFVLRTVSDLPADRSWEALVAIAHLCLARGFACAQTPAEADDIVVAVGKVDAMLRLSNSTNAGETAQLPTREMLPRLAPGQTLLAFCPDDRVSTVPWLPVSSALQAVGHIARHCGGAEVAMPANRAHRSGLAAMTSALLIMLGAAGYVASALLRPAPAVVAPQPEPTRVPVQVAPPHWAKVMLLRAVPDSGCAAALFASAPLVATEAALEKDTLSLRHEAGLCGLEVAAQQPDTLFSVTVSPAGAFMDTPPARQASGSVRLMFRAVHAREAKIQLESPGQKDALVIVVQP